MEYQLIDNKKLLIEICQEIETKSDWIGFDTEFIGERRYMPLLCLIQISSEIGLFIIDSLKIKNLEALSKILENPNILKITHAGSNDYHIFNQLFGTLPQNVIDVQIASGFVGDGYPSSFQKLVNKYLKVKLSKTQTVSDWQKRPISDKQIKYALNDVIHLYPLWSILKNKLEKNNRLSWVIEECAEFSQAEYYTHDFLSDILSNKIMGSLNMKERIFFIRLHLWRENEAKTLDLSREKVLPNKLIPIIVKVMKAGKKSLSNDRRIPDYIIKKNWEILNELYQKEIDSKEEEILSNIKIYPQISEKQNIAMDLINQVFKYICVKNKISGTLLMPRSDFNKMKDDINYVPSYLKKTWRKKILGEHVINWLENRGDLDMSIEKDEIKIKLR